MTFAMNFAHALGAPDSTAVFRETVQDFQVSEDLGFEPAGSGEHIFLHIRKRGENTQWLAGQIARFAGVPQRDVGFAGLKDRHAVTTQWFSVYLPKGREPAWQDFVHATEADIDLLEVTRHNRKLRRGEHAGNKFVIRLTHLSQPQSLPARLAAVADQGVPNYFGEQRFGRDAGNLRLAAEWLEHHKPVRPKGLRGMVMSAARSWLFNRVLSERVTAGNWHRVIEGDALDDKETGPTGPLWGRGRSPAQGAAAAVEQSVVAAWPLWAEGLEHCGLNQERRPLVLHPNGFDWQLEGDQLTLRFALGAGEFATAVLRELTHLQPAKVEERAQDNNG